MGRAERRKIEKLTRADRRIANRTRMSKDEITRIKNKMADDMSIANVENLMTCIALAEHRLYGFGQTRILRTLNYIEELSGSILNGEKTIDDLKQELRAETGVVIKC